MPFWKFLFNSIFCYTLYAIDVYWLHSPEIYSALSVLFLYIWFTAIDAVHELKNNH